MRGLATRLTASGREQAPRAGDQPARGRWNAGWGIKILAVWIVLIGLPSPAAAQSAHLAVIVGLAGDPEYAELYGKWGASLVDAATGQYGIPKAQVHYLTEKPESDAKRSVRRCTKHWPPIS